MKIVTTANLDLTIVLGSTQCIGVVSWSGSQRPADMMEQQSVLSPGSLHIPPESRL